MHKKHFYSINLEMTPQDDVRKASLKVVKAAITLKQFDMCAIPYYCKNCFEEKCFVCGLRHSVTDMSKNAKCSQVSVDLKTTPTSDLHKEVNFDYLGFTFE